MTGIIHTSAQGIYMDTTFSRDMILQDRRAQIMLFAVIAIGTFLDWLDGTIVTVALPEIAASFSMSASDVSWIVTVYYLTMAGLILVFGKISDSGHIRGVIIWGFTIFTSGSLMCALSWSYEMLLVFRAIQGLGSAMLASSCLMLVVKFLPPGMIAFGMSLSVLGGSLGSALGPVIGGILTEMLSWHWIFLINVPIGIISIILSIRVVPSLELDAERRFDYVGSCFLFIFLATVLFVVESSSTHGISSTSLIILAVSVVFLVLFYLREKKIDYPVIRLDVFRNHGLVIVAVVYMLVNAYYMGLMYILPFFFTVELGMNTMGSGMMMLVQAVTMLVLCLFIGKAVDRRGWKLFTLAAVACMVISALFFIVSDAETGIIMPVIGLVVMGLVFALGGSSLTASAIDQVPEEYHGFTSAFMSFIIYLGAAIGTTLYSAMFNIGSGVPGVSIENLLPVDFMEGYVFVMTVTMVLGFISIALMVWVCQRFKGNSAKNA